MRRRELEKAAVEWALNEAESQLRNRQREYSWSLTAPSGVDVYVEAVRLTTSVPAAVKFDLSAGATGWLPGHARGDRILLLPREGHMAREPALLYLVFETDGPVYAYKTLEEAGDSIEAIDLNDGHYCTVLHTGRYGSPSGYRSSSSSSHHGSSPPITIGSLRDVSGDCTAFVKTAPRRATNSGSVDRVKRPCSSGS